jgi:hypothetical protein
VPQGRVVYHPVPAFLAEHKDRAATFMRCWNHLVGSGRLLFAYDPAGRAVVAAHEGEDAYGALSQMRTLWS